MNLLSMNSRKRRKTPLIVSILSALGAIWLQTAVTQVDFSALNRYLPDSLKQVYSIPALADDDLIFAVDSLGSGLFANFAANRQAGRILVVNPNLPKDSGLIWLSPEIEGQMEYLYAADINGDGFEELVLATRKLGGDGWSRLHIWRWNAGAGTSVARCSDTAPAYFSAPTRAAVVDVDDDGIQEILLSAVGPGGSDSLVYVWSDKGYCLPE